MPSKKDPEWAIELQKRHLATLTNPPDFASWKVTGWKHDSADAIWLVDQWISGEINHKSSDYAKLYKSDPRWWKHAFKNFADNINNLRKRHNARLQLRKASKSSENTTPQTSNRSSSVDASAGAYLFVF